MYRKNLVVVRAGDQSLHPQWLSKVDRNWDLAISYFGDFPDRYLLQYDYLHLCKGTKWQGLSDFVSTQRELISNYNYIWFPDDDLFTDGATINRFFEICDYLQLTIAQPALTQYSYYSWEITLQNPNCDYRLTNFVEIMAPCFSVSKLNLFSDTFSYNTSGWGLEWLWSSIAENKHINKLGIIDSTPIFHTRPVGANAHGGSVKSPIVEMEKLLEKYGLKATPPVVYGTFTL